MGHDIYLTRVILGTDEDPSIECQGQLDKQNKISQVFHCSGLLLCVLRDDLTKYIVWNPYLGETRSIESRYSHRPARWNWFTYALRYEEKGSSCRGYLEIYDFDSSTWNTLDITPNTRILPDRGGVSLKGNTYWPASHINTGEDDDHIICFNFTSESFGPLLPLPFYSENNDDVTLSCVKEEKLAVLPTHSNETSSLELKIWINTKIEAEKVLWTKFLKVETEAEFYALINCGSFFIDEEKKVAMGLKKPTPRH
ncbi:F-box/kelch-repeat protein [Raphanus sativus]|nr:F-box/kelch-repeat protein [Raphanus sativus]